MCSNYSISSGYIYSVRVLSLFLCAVSCFAYAHSLWLFALVFEVLFRLLLLTLVCLLSFQIHQQQRHRHRLCFTLTSTNRKITPFSCCWCCVFFFWFFIFARCFSRALPQKASFALLWCKHSFRSQCFSLTIFIRPNRQFCAGCVCVIVTFLVVIEIMRCLYSQLNPNWHLCESVKNLQMRTWSVCISRIFRASIISEKMKYVQANEEKRANAHNTTGSDKEWHKHIRYATLSLFVARCSVGCFFFLWSGV